MELDVMLSRVKANAKNTNQKTFYKKQMNKY